MQIRIIKQGNCLNCGLCCKQNDPFLGLPQPCMFYQEHGDGHCKIYHVRPDVCRRYPIAPRDIACLPNCGYNFRDEKGQKIDMYMLKSTATHLNVAVQRRRSLAQNRNRRDK